MSFRQYTKCVPPEEFGFFEKNEKLNAVLIGLGFGGFFALAAIFTAAPWCALIAIEIALFAGTVAFCDWWLESRLICLETDQFAGGDRFAVGMLVSTEGAYDKSGFTAFDNDYSINLLLYPNNPNIPNIPKISKRPGVTQAVAEQTPPFGYLIAKQDAITLLDLDWEGETAEDKGTGLEHAVLHAEFEGAGIRDLKVATAAALGLAIAALVVCIAAGPVGAILAYFLALLALIAALFGVTGRQFTGGDPTDVNQALGSLHKNVNSTALGADILLVQGTWVYDSMHEGWNELHPIKMCTPVGRWNGIWPTNIVKIIERGPAAIQEAQTPATREKQKTEQHSWQVHPEVDGCEVPVI